MAFDLQTAFAVRERADGLLERDTFDLASARPVEGPLPVKGTEIRAAKPGELPYRPALTGEQKAQATVEKSFKDKGQEVPFGLQFDWMLSSRQAQAVTQTALAPELTALQGIRGAIDNSGRYEIMDRIKRGILESEDTKRFYDYIPGSDTLPKWGKIVANIGEDIIALGSMGLAKGLLKKELLARDISRKMESAADEFAGDIMENYLPSGFKSEEALRESLKAEFKNRLFADVTAPEVSAAEVGSLGKLEAGIEPSILQKYADRQNLFSLLRSEFGALGKRGSVVIPKVGESVQFSNPEGVILKGVIKEITGKRAIIDMDGRQVVATLSQLSKPLTEQPSAGGMAPGVGREVPEQIKKWLEKGVTITDAQAPIIRIVEPEAKVKDISGKMVDLPKGHEMRAYKLSNGKIWLHDGKDVVIDSKQLQKLTNFNVVLGESADYVKLQETKVVDEEGKPKAVYSGHSNMAMYGKYDPKKSTAGGFYATEDPEIASRYATGKFGVKEYYERGEQYRLAGKNGKFNKKLWQVELTPEQKKKIDVLKKETINSYGDYRYGGLAEMDRWIEQNKGYDPIARRAAYTGGSHNLQNIYDYMEQMGYTISYTEQPSRILPNGKTLEEKSEYITRRGKEENIDPDKDEVAYDKFNQEYQKLYDSSIEKPITERQRKNDFEELLDAIGIKWNSYEWIQPGVQKAYLNIKNPIDTSKPFPPDLMKSLEERAKGERSRTEEELSYSHWTKEYPLKQWIKDIKEGNEFWSTHIPAKALPIIKNFGYDGIKDTGGKMGGKEHAVWIAFEPEQIVSAIQDIKPKQPMAGGMIEQPGEPKKRGIEAKKEALQERLVTVEDAKSALEDMEPIHKAFLRRIRRYRDDYLKEELQGIPKQYMTTGEGIAPDEALQELRERWGVDLRDEVALKDFLIDLSKQIKSLDNIIEANKPKMVRMKETTVLKMQENAQDQMQKRAMKEMQRMATEQARITKRLEQKAYREGKKKGAEIRKQKYFGAEMTKDQRRELYVVALQKGVIYTDFSGKKHDRLHGLIKYYNGASFDQLKSYIGQLSGNADNPSRLFKLYGDIDRDAEALQIINKVREDWQDINKVEIYSLDPARIIEKVTQQNVWEDNILADNTFNVISAADEAMFDRKVKELKEFDSNREGVKAGSKESAEIMRKFEAKEALTPKEQKVVNYLRSKYDAWIKEANEMRALVGRKPIPYRQDYLTHIVEQNILQDFFRGNEAGMAGISEGQLDAIRKGDYTKGNMPFNKFAQQRLTDKSKYDAIGNYIKYMDVILREIYYTPAIYHSRKFIEYALSKQPNAYKAIDRLLNDLKGKVSIVDQNLIGTIAGSQPVKMLRSQIAKSALVGNINFWAMNLSNFAVSYDEIGNYLNIGMAKFLGSSDWRKFAFENSVMLKGRAIDPDFIDKSMGTKIEEVVGAITNLIEYNNVGSTFVGAYFKGVDELGYTKEKAIEYADAIARRTQVGYKKYELNAWMRSNSGMLMSQFQSWTFNAMNHVLYDLGVANIPEDIKNAFTKDKTSRTRWGAFLTLLGVAIAADAIYTWMKLRVPYSIDALKPSVAGLNPGRYSDIGPVKIVKDAVLSFTGKRQETRDKARLRVLTSVVPGGAQLSRFAQGQIFPKKSKESAGGRNKLKRGGL